MPYLPKRNPFTQPEGSNGAAQGTARTKYPYKKDHRRSQEISPPSQASSGPMNIHITEQLTQNCPPCHQVTDGGGRLSDSAAPRAFSYRVVESISEVVGRPQSKPKVTLRLGQRADSSTPSAVFFARDIFMYFIMYIQKSKDHS